MTLPRTADVVVIGGGVTGAATAYEAAARGASVVLVEKEDGPAREGSGRAQGSLRIQGRHGTEFPLAQEAVRRWAEAAETEFAESTGRRPAGDIEFVRGGNLYFQTAADERPLLEGLVAEAHRAGLTEVALLDPDEVRAIVPGATGRFLGAMFSPVDAACQPEKGTALYTARAERAGAHMAYGVKATRIVEQGSRIAGVETSAGTVFTGAVVLGAGVWTPYLADTVGLKVPIMPVVMSELETEPMAPVLRPTVRAFGFGARQRPDGRTVISAGLDAKVGHDVTLADFNGLRFWLPRAMSFRRNLKLGVDLPRIGRQLRARSTLAPELVPDRSPEPAVDIPLVDGSLARLSNVFPAFRTARVGRYWAGLVDMTPDGLPVIDGFAGPAGLTIVTVLSGHGFTLGPVLGEIAADLSLDANTRWKIDDFALSRFASGRVAAPEMMI